MLSAKAALKRSKINKDNLEKQEQIEHDERVTTKINEAISEGKTSAYLSYAFPSNKLYSKLLSLGYKVKVYTSSTQIYWDKESSRK